eukprot:CAMPEP_0168351000 /NCGR_PEP_ID=MMETSP0213-20121227/21523_1 /TAXON_ID=151035 /ORGANISM="Euplotes harpa, Strain FSP1.4" /LENGTH=76 /DNA_ID=CAMNT_0008361593 /DNA_START=247 /DNA_END=477 /DNA_ORIENTATION=-
MTNSKINTISVKVLTLKALSAQSLLYLDLMNLYEHTTRGIMIAASHKTLKKPLTKFMEKKSISIPRASKIEMTKSE